MVWRPHRREAADAPRRADGVPIAELPLSPQEAFVWSQLDGHTAPEEVSALTGIELEAVHRMLRRLESLGAVHYGGVAQRETVSRHDPRREPTERPRPPAAGAAPARGSRPRASRRDPSARPPTLTSATPTSSEARAVKNEVELSDEQKQRIDVMFAQLDSATHYALLGVAADADKKDIKDAYFALVALYHPDKFFRRELGDYRGKLEQIFRRLTEASDVLTRRGSRAEYDAYLAARQKTRSLDAVLTSLPPPPPRSVRPPTPADPQLEGSPPAVVDPRPVPQLTNAERSRALARRLVGSSRAPRQAPDEVLRTPVLSEAARAELERIARSRGPQLQRFLRAGQDAVAEGAWVSAVNALRIALTLNPDDDEIRALYTEADDKASEQLSASYEARARYERSSGDWEAAAASWSRVASARKDDPTPLRQAAECYAHTGEPNRGLAPARQAVLLAPKDADNHLILVKLYELCGMTASAVGAAGRALEHNPGHPELAALHARLSAST